MYGAPRGENTKYHYPMPGRIEFICELPLAEVIYDFYDRLKSVTQGYGSFDYELMDYRQSDLIKLDILVNGEQVDALSQLAHRSKARERGLKACEQLKKEIPRQMFKIAIQAAHWIKHCGPRKYICPSKRRNSEMLWGGYLTKAQVAGKTEGRQEAHENGGQC